MRAILASHPQVQWEGLLLRTQFAPQQLTALPFQPSDSPHNALWRCQWVIPPYHPFLLIVLDSLCSVGLHLRDDVG